MKSQALRSSENSSNSISPESSMSRLLRSLSMFMDIWNSSFRMATSFTTSTWPVPSEFPPTAMNAASVSFFTFYWYCFFW